MTDLSERSALVPALGLHEGSDGTLVVLDLFEQFGVQAPTDQAGPRCQTCDDLVAPDARCYSGASPRCQGPASLTD